MGDTLFSGMTGSRIRGILAGFLIPALPVIDVVGGLVFAVLIYSMLNAYAEIRMFYV